MAELIDKGALYDAMTEEYKKHYAGTGKGYDFTIAMQMVQNQPTVTEAEIRAKAIEEFAEKLKSDYIFCDIGLILSNNNIMFESASVVTFKQYIDKIAEQLKGE